MRLEIERFSCSARARFTSRELTVNLCLQLRFRIQSGVARPGFPISAQPVAVSLPYVEVALVARLARRSD